MYYTESFEIHVITEPRIIRIGVKQRNQSKKRFLALTEKFCSPVEFIWETCICQEK